MLIVLCQIEMSINRTAIISIAFTRWQQWHSTIVTMMTTDWTDSDRWNDRHF